MARAGSTNSDTSGTACRPTSVKKNSRLKTGPGASPLGLFATHVRVVHRNFVKMVRPVRSFPSRCARPRRRCAGSRARAPSESRLSAEPRNLRVLGSRARGREHGVFWKGRRLRGRGLGASRRASVGALAHGGVVYARSSRSLRLRRAFADADARGSSPSRPGFFRVWRSAPTAGEEIVADLAPPPPSHQQPSQKTFKIKQKLGKKQKQNRPLPQWIRMRTGNTIRCAPLQIPPNPPSGTVGKITRFF